MNPQTNPQGLLVRRELNLGGEWFVEEVWDVTHPRCPVRVYDRPVSWWRRARRNTDALMVTIRKPMPAAHPLSKAQIISFGGNDAA